MQAYATPATGTPAQLRLVGSPSPGAVPPAGAAGNGLHELLEQVAELVAERVATRLASSPQQHADEWLDSRGAAAYLGIGRDSLRRLSAEGSIPTEQAAVGCKLFFRRSDLDAWRCAASGPIEPLRGRRHG